MSTETFPSYNTAAPYGGAPQPPPAQEPAPPADADLGAIIGSPPILTLSSGTRVQMRRLKGLALFKFLAIITAGLGPDVVDDLSLRDDLDEGEFVKRLLLMVGLAVPKAGAETMAFLRAMVEPVGMIHGVKLAKQDRQRQEAASKALDAELGDAELEDMLDIAVAIVQTEGPHLQALGKKVRTAVTLFRSTGQNRPSPTSPASTS